MLRIESGGLPREAINDLCKLKLPALEYLELWIGTSEYGGDSTIQDLIPILQSDLFPKLKYLGLRNAEYTDDIAIAIAKSTIIKQLIELDLSLGTLCKKGAQALINCPQINELDTLDISYNYLEPSLYPEEFEQILYLNCDVIAESQKYWDVNWEHDINIPIARYCQVRE